jgi:Methylase involved in ubiquinone/menaquinone biosynthesis
MTSLAKQPEGRRQSLVPPTTVGGIMRANWQTQIVKTAVDLMLFDATPWMHLSDLAKSGKPYAEVNKDAKAEEFFPELAASLFAWNYANATEVVEELDVASLVKSATTGADAKNGYRVLDLACGSAVWSIPAAKASQKVKVDALDFPAVLEIAKEFTTRNEVASQYNYLAGNWADVKFEEGVYDLVFLGHILHSEGRSRSKELLEAVYRATKTGGSLVVAEFTTDDTRANPPFGAMFAVNMFVLTTEGCVFTDNELDSVITEAGFSGIKRVAQDPMYATVVHAVKK